MLVEEIFKISDNDSEMASTRATGTTPEHQICEMGQNSTSVCWLVLTIMYHGAHGHRRG